MTTTAQKLVVAEVLEAAFAVVRGRPVLLIGTALLGAIPGAVFSHLGADAISAFIARTSPAAAWADGRILRYAIHSLGTAAICACVGFVFGLEALVVRHPHARATTLLATCVRRVPALAAIIALGTGATALGGACTCFVLGLLAPVMFALAPAVCVSETVGPLLAMRRSVVLTKGNRFPILGLVLIVSCPRVAFWVGMVATLDTPFMRHVISQSAIPAVDAITSAAMYLAAGVVFGVVYVRLADTSAPTVVDIADVFA